MHLHPQLQQLLKAPEILTPEINPYTGASEKILSQACLICGSDMKLSYWGHLGCIFNSHHCWVSQIGDILYLRPLGITPFHVTINYRTQRTLIGLWEPNNPLAFNEPLLTLEEAISLDEVSEDYLQTLVIFS